MSDKQAAEVRFWSHANWTKMFFAVIFLFFVSFGILGLAGGPKQLRTEEQVSEFLGQMTGVAVGVTVVALFAASRLRSKTTVDGTKLTVQYPISILKFTEELPESVIVQPLNKTLWFFLARSSQCLAMQTYYQKRKVTVPIKVLTGEQVSRYSTLVTVDDKVAFVKSVLGGS